MKHLFWKIISLFKKKNPKDLMKEMDFILVVPNIYASMMVDCLGVAVKVFSFAKIEHIRYLRTESQEIIGIKVDKELSPRDMIAIAQGYVLACVTLGEMGSVLGINVDDHNQLVLEPNNEVISDGNIRFFRASLERMKNSDNLSRFLVKCGFNNSEEEDD